MIRRAGKTAEPTAKRLKTDAADGNREAEKAHLLEYEREAAMAGSIAVDVLPGIDEEDEGQRDDDDPGKPRQTFMT